MFFIAKTMQKIHISQY